MRFNKLDINPAENPAILDTCSWDNAAVRQMTSQLSKEYIEGLAASADEKKPLPQHSNFSPYDGSLSYKDGKAVFLAGLQDGQQVFAEVLDEGKPPVLGEPISEITLKNGRRVAIQKTDAAIVDKFFRDVNPAKGSRALKSTPRLGIGVRMTTACWPAILKAMDQKGFSANIIQNSVRELNFMSNLLNAEPPETNYACGFGTIETGYTGSSYEGLWLAGVLEALKYPKTLAYGADADHLQVKRGSKGMAKAKRYIDSCRYYSFYTLDMADILNYQCLTERSDSAASDFARGKFSAGSMWNEIQTYHTAACVINGRKYSMDKDVVNRLIGKYWDSLEVLEELTGYIRSIKNGRDFDLEFTIDEHPPEIAAFDCLTSDEEYLFVLREIKRRNLPVTHVASNYGVEKGLDYRCPDGLEGLERRIASQFRLAEEFGVMLDFHSADDLTSAPRQIIRKATGGKHHFKISPMLQIIYADVLQDFHPDLFEMWWNDARAYAMREATAGSPFAKECLAEYEANPVKKPSRHHMLFHHYSFAFVGKRDMNGQFLHRAKFYNLSKAFYDEYENRLAGYLGNLADELF